MPIYDWVFGFVVLIFYFNQPRRSSHMKPTLSGERTLPTCNVGGMGDGNEFVFQSLVFDFFSSDLPRLRVHELCMFS